VIDRVEPGGGNAHNYEALWHLDTDSAAIAADNPLRVSSINTDQSNITLIAADHPALSLEVITAQQEPEWQGWKSPAHGRQGSELPSPTPTYRWTSTDPQRIVTLLYPTPAGVTCPVVGIAADSSVDVTGITLVLKDGETVTLDENDYRAE